jgi:hypothetical protein
MLAAPCSDSLCHLIGAHLLEPVAAAAGLLHNGRLLVVLLLRPDSAPGVVSPMQGAQGCHSGAAAKRLCIVAAHSRARL